MRIGWRSSGGVVIVDISRMPVRLISSVRTGCGCHGENVDVGAERLQVLFVLDTETLFLVNDDERRYLKANLLAEQTMRADDDVNTAIVHPCKSCLHLCVTFKPGERRNLDRNCAYRSVKVFMCCCTNNVVGTKTATCLPSCTALNTARTAISVLP